MTNNTLTSQRHNKLNTEPTIDSVTPPNTDVVSELRPKLENAMLSVTPLTLLSATSEKANSILPPEAIEYLNNLKNLEWWEPVLFGSMIIASYFAANRILPKKWEKYSLPSSLGVGALAVLIANGMGPDGKTIIGTMIALAVAIGAIMLVIKKGNLSKDNLNPFKGNNANTQDTPPEAGDTGMQRLPCGQCNEDTPGENCCDWCGTLRNTENNSNPPPIPNDPNTGSGGPPPPPPVINNDPWS